MKNLKKKGFTIVELVIVIAVVAVLAAVLIPTFVNLTRKANESTDIQAVRNMNVFLTQANALEEVNSILDVYEVFEESDYVVENYQPLYKGRYFYYDKQQKQILYVDENDKVLFPKNLEGTTQGSNDWFSLSMEIKTEAVSDTNGVYTITKAEQYAYVVEQLNKGITKDVTIKVSGELDFKGSCIAIKELPYGRTLKIIGENNATIKNVTTIKSNFVSNQNNDNINKDYGVAALFGSIIGSLEISNVRFENVNVKNTHAGIVGLISGYLHAPVTLDNVSFDNCNVIGHRNVGALFGQLVTGDAVKYTNQNYAEGGAAITIKNSVALNNVKVQTVGGRSGKYIGCISTNINNHLVTSNRQDCIVNIQSELQKIQTNNLTLSIYECEQNTGNNLGLVNGAITSWIKKTNGEEKTYSYIYSADSCFVWAFFDVEDNMNEKNLIIDNLTN